MELHKEFLYLWGFEIKIKILQQNIAITDKQIICSK
jgi:hypothetical protein